MEDMWTGPGRVKPVALDYDAIMDDTFVTPPLRAPPAAPAANGSSATANGSSAAPTSSSNGETSAAGAASHANGSANGHSVRQLRDQKELSVKENLELFIDR